MGHGASLPSEYKQKIHAAFQVQDTAAWKACDDVDDCLPELIKLRRLASALVHGARRKSTIYVHQTVKSSGVKKLLHAAMASNPLFKRCRTPEKEEMLGAFANVHFAVKDVIIKQGDRGDAFYVLENGTVEFHVTGRGRVGSCTSTRACRSRSRKRRTRTRATWRITLSRTRRRRRRSSRSRRRPGRPSWTARRRRSGSSFVSPHRLWSCVVIRIRLMCTVRSRKSSRDA